MLAPNKNSQPAGVALKNLDYVMCSQNSAGALPTETRVPEPASVASRQYWCRVKTKSQPCYSRCQEKTSLFLQLRGDVRQQPLFHSCVLCSPFSNHIIACAQQCPRVPRGFPRIDPPICDQNPACACWVLKSGHDKFRKQSHILSVSMVFLRPLIFSSSLSDSLKVRRWLPSLLDDT